MACPCDYSGPAIGDTCPSCGADGYLETFRVLAVQFEPTHREEIREIAASCYAEAFGIAERADAGAADFVYGVPVDSFERARLEGIAFNEADGLLVDEARS